jgi:hypothetical protein
MDYNIVENRLVRFDEIFENLGNFEIKISKKTRVYFKIFGQNQFQKFKVLHSRQFMEVKNHEKLVLSYNLTPHKPYPHLPGRLLQLCSSSHRQRRHLHHRFTELPHQ